MALPVTDKFAPTKNAVDLTLPVAVTIPPVTKFAPVILPEAVINPVPKLAVLALPVALRVVANTPVVLTLPTLALPVALTSPPVIRLAPVILPVAVISPVPKLAVLAFPVALKVVANTPVAPRLPTLALPVVVMPLLIVVADVTNDVAPTFPILALPEMLKFPNTPIAVTCVWLAFTLNVVPVNVNPVPAVYVPAPLNCVNVISVEPIVAPALFVHTQPVSALVNPCSMKVYAETISLGASKSVERVNT